MEMIARATHTGSTERISGLRLPDIHREEKNNGFQPQKPGGGPGTGGQRQFVFADNVALACRAELKHIGLPPGKSAALVQRIQSIPGLRGREQREDGAQKIYLEDIPKFCFWDGEKSAVTNELPADLAVLVVALPVRRIAARVLFLTLLESVPADIRLEWIAERAKEFRDNPDQERFGVQAYADQEMCALSRGTTDPGVFSDRFEIPLSDVQEYLSFVAEAAT